MSKERYYTVFWHVDGEAVSTTHERKETAKQLIEDLESVGYPVQFYDEMGHGQDDGAKLLYESPDYTPPVEAQDA